MAKEVAPAWQCYAADFIGDLHVKVMTPDEVGVYFILLNHCWIEDGLPNKPKMLESLCMNGCSTSVQRPFAEIWKVVKKRFYVDKGLLRNKRQEEYREELKAKRAKAKLAGIASGKARKKRAK